jgi:hypothetical protein
MKNLIITPLVLEDQIELLPQLRIIRNHKKYRCDSVEVAWIKWGVAFDWNH